MSSILKAGALDQAAVARHPLATRSDAAFVPRAAVVGDTAVADAGDDAATLAQAAYRRGLDDGRGEAAAILAAEQDMLRALADGLEALTPVPEPVLAALLGAATERLIVDQLGLCIVDRACFDARVAAITAQLTAELSPATLRLHPDDVALLAGAELSVAVIGDDRLGRGDVRLDTAHGWIEDGPTLRLQRLRAALTSDAGAVR